MNSPFKGSFRLTSPRGNRTLLGTTEYHKGIDLVGTEDIAVYAVADGTVYNLYEKDGFGKYVRQHLSDGKRIYYGHLQSFCVKDKSFVKKGEKIGVMGCTGKAYGAHLHLELRPSGTGADSLDICEFTGIPNAVGVYQSFADTYKYSSDSVVDKLMHHGIIDQKNRVNWELMLSGHSPLITEYVRVLFERCCDKISELERRT